MPEDCVHTIFRHFSYQSFAYLKTFATFATAITKGAIAQLVEQRTENPCVPGSIPGGTTEREVFQLLFFYFHKQFPLLNIRILHPKKSRNKTAH